MGIQINVNLQRILQRLIWAQFKRDSTDIQTIGDDAIMLRNVRIQPSCINTPLETDIRLSIIVWLIVVDINVVKNT